ncbi:MAG TPA: 3-hydroxyacyl-CoA dehydrogenase/enoyl-CoA hydratase family protein [Desulfohalobiaceae bacterium]|nr:3-hydroxyacyl-CoA dehydrogenase/enoyl-CoA hydratase family protein [Desulfohalobiaceae bacterium]
MRTDEKLYPTFFNPLLIKTQQDLPQEMAIIGAGTIGPDIGYYLQSALPESQVYLIDIQEKALKKAEQRIEGYVQKAKDKKKMSPDKADQVLSNFHYSTDYKDIQKCQLVIEAATENIDLKQKIFSELESIVNKECILTSNTSSIPAKRIFSNLKHPQRCTVTHFFAPAWRSLPVEVISWEQVSQDMLDYLCRFFASTGKVPLMTDDAICFMLDRIFDNWCNEAAFLLDQATSSQIDQVSENLVMAGPFFVLNLANGNPIIVETNTLQMEEGEHYRPALILSSVQNWLTKKPGEAIDVSDSLASEIKERLLGILFSQSFDIIDRRIGTLEDLNFGAQIAFGFKQGPFDFMQELGEKELVRIMDSFQSKRPGFPRAQSPFNTYQKFNRYLLVDILDDVAIITIRRPQAMNAINQEMTNEIQKVLEAYSSDPSVKGFILTGYGTQAFSAGADIGRFPEVLGDRQAAINLARECAQVQNYLDYMDKPVVAAINGLALGGGLELAIRCHSIVASNRAMFQFPEITLGILPGIGGCIVPYRKWPQGANQFHEMLCLGKKISGSDAERIGMVESLHENYRDLIDGAIQEIDRLQGSIPRIADGKMDIPEPNIPEQPMAGKLTLSPEAVSLIASTIKQGASAELFEEALEIGYKGFGDIACTQAAREGITAFLEKRSPVFK